MERIEALVVTHVHPDHYLGLVDLSAALPRAVPLYHLEDNRRALEGTFHYLFPRSFNLQEMRFGVPFVAAGLDVTPFDTHHFKAFSTAGLLLAEGGRRVGYAPDFKRADEGALDVGALDLFAVDGSSLDKDGLGHRSIRGGLREPQARRTLFTHVGHVKVPHRDLVAIVENEGAFGIAYDGMAVEV